jgi:enamine deaminase RidA (YjgF/YER057c/UK114 family)
MRQVGHIRPSSGVPQTKQVPNAPRSIGGSATAAGGRSGRGGGIKGAGGVATGGGGGSTGGGAGATSAGRGEGAGGTTLEGASGFAGASGGFASSLSRRRRKSDIGANTDSEGLRPSLELSLRPERLPFPARTRKRPNGVGTVPEAVFFSDETPVPLMAPTASERLRELNIELPPPPSPAGAYSPVVVSDRRAWVSGQIASEGGEILKPGKVDQDVSLEVAKDLARRASLQAVSALSVALGTVDRVRRIERVIVYVASSPGFYRQHEVANGATEVLKDLWGEKEGRPARAAIGVAALPLNAPVEVEMVVRTF